ncbi:MAG: nucleoside triphosphate pyrophosphohydrolase family protein [Bacteroidia bacterium]
MLEKINFVKEFHEVFKIGSREIPAGVIDEKEYTLRHRLLEEENNEYLEACKNGDLIEIADALGDQLYIVFGTILKHGLQHKIDEVFEEIHRSNMSKLDDKGEPIFREDGKIMKSTNYFKPDIKKALEK